MPKNPPLTWLCITPEKRYKTARLMHALHRGWPGARVIEGEPPDDDSPFMVWGQEWLTERIVPAAHARGRPYWQVDNGFWRPARGGENGYYRFSYRGFSPVLLEDPDTSRAPDVLRPWRTYGEHVLVALSGVHFAHALGMRPVIENWNATIVDRVVAATDRDVRVRPRYPLPPHPIDEDLLCAWAMVTHASNAAVDAVLMGVPVVVHPMNPAAPVGGTLLSDLDRPPLPDRAQWWASLMNQQFTLGEMANGVARRCLYQVEMQVDHGLSCEGGKPAEPVRSIHCHKTE